jgi:hypothetical protein
MPELLTTYLSELRLVRHAAVPETSGYPALHDLLDGIGDELRPRVRCIIHPASQGAGIPDGGLFTPDQLKESAADSAMLAQIPARGVIEVKSTAEDVEETIRSAQVSKYVARYGQVLVTNYWDFALVTQEESLGTGLKVGERYKLAPSESEFWRAAANPAAMAAVHGERFTEYLKRVMLQRARLAEPRDVAYFLASYARDAKSRIERSDLPGLTGVRLALEEALGLKFQGEKGDHFFRSTLVQTLFYGLFSSWCCGAKNNREPTGPVSASIGKRRPGISTCPRSARYSTKSSSPRA